jgi:5'-3' exonuclease
MSRGFLLIDGNNIGHAANCTQPLAVGDMPTQAIYGFLRTLRPMVTTFPQLTPIVLWDGASWRRMQFKEYKANRDKTPETKTEIELARQREAFKRQAPLIKAAVKALGIRQVWAINYEADDHAGVLVNRHASKGIPIVLISGDTDWIQLVRDKVIWIDPIRNHRLTAGSLPKRLGFIPDKKKFGVTENPPEGFIPVASARAWLETKALMGDVSDNIPGVGGIGPKGAAEFMAQYKSVAEFMNQVIDKTIDVDALPKKFRELATNVEKTDFYNRNLMLMDLNTDKRPAAINYEVTHQPFHAGSFRKICERLCFKSIIERFDDWCEPFAPKTSGENAA